MPQLIDQAGDRPSSAAWVRMSAMLVRMVASETLRRIAFRKASSAESMLIWIAAMRARVAASSSVNSRAKFDRMVMRARRWWSCCAKATHCGWKVVSPWPFRSMRAPGFASTSASTPSNTSLAMARPW